MIKRNKETRRAMFLIAFGVILYVGLQNIGVVTGALRSCADTVRPILSGLCIAFVLNVLAAPLERLMRRWRWLAGKPKLVRASSIILCFLLTLGLMALILLVMLPRLSDSIQMIISMLPRIGTALNNALTSFMEQQHIEQVLIDRVNEYISNLTQQLIQLLSDSSASIAAFFYSTVVSAASSLYQMLFGSMLAVYVLYHKERIHTLVLRLMDHYLPDAWNTRILSVSKLSYSIYYSFVRGQVLQALILGLLCYGTMLIFGFPQAAVISILSAVMSLVPIIGGWVSGAAGTLLVLAVSPGQALWFLVYILVLQQVVGTFIYPRIVGQQLGLPSLLVLSAILVGQSVYGITGILFSIPLAAVDRKSVV